jgi:hypothetical protein
MKVSPHCRPVPGHARDLHPNIEIEPTPRDPQGQLPAAPSSRRAATRRPATSGPFEPIWPAAIAHTPSGPAPSPSSLSLSLPSLPGHDTNAHTAAARTTPMPTPLPTPLPLAR